MATATRRKRRRRQDEDREERPEPRRRRPRRRRSGLPRTLWVIIGVLLLVWLAPMIVGHTGLLDWIVGSAASDLNGRVSVRSASLGWFSAPRLSDVEVLDSDGDRVLTIPEAAGDRSLLSLLVNSSKLGRFRLVKPTLHIVVRQDGSNLEDLLAKFLEAPDEQSGRVDVGVEVLDGTVMLLDPRKQRTWQVDGFQLKLDAPAGRAMPLDIQASGQVTDEASPARFDVTAKLFRSDGQPPAAGAPDASAANEVKLRTESFPLALLEPMVARFARGYELEGRLTGTLECRFQGTGPLESASIDGRLVAEQLDIAMPALGRDRATLAHVDATCKGDWRQSRLQIEQLSVESDVGNLSATGAVDLRQDVLDDLLQWLPQQTFDVDGQIDLAKLAAILPGTLRIREGTKVTSGQLQLALASRPGRYGMTWQGQIQATDLAASNRGQSMRWDQPIQVALSARQSAQGPVLERLNWDSDFLSLRVSGNRSRLSATAQFDMSRLASRVRGFVDVGELRFAGAGQANVHWVRSEKEEFQTDGDFEIRGFELTMPERPLWKEDKLTANFTATGKTDFSANTQLATGQLDIKAGTDHLVARLVEPVVDLHDGGTWTVRLESSGQLAPWLARVSPWVVLEDWKLGGTYQLVALATGSTAAVQVSQSSLSLGELEVDGPGLRVIEPAAELALAGGWEARRRRVELKSAKLEAGSLSALAEELVFSLSEEGKAELAGSLRCRGELEPLQKWFLVSGEPPPVKLEGSVAARADFRQTGGVISGNVDATMDELAVTHQSGQKIREQQVRFVGQGRYDNATRTLQIDQAELTSGTVGARVLGQLAMADTSPKLQMEGQLDYDLEKLSHLLKSRTDGNVFVTGRGSESFSYRGPLSPASAQGQAALGWDWGDVYGFRLGPGRLEASLAGGTLRIRPVSLDVSQGRVFLAPELKFSDKSPVLEVARGQLVDRVRINPRMCAHFLQYIAPVLAGVATAEGSFSVELDGCRVPLDNPSAGEVAGRMTVHSVEIGPGPVIRELAVVMGREKAAKLKKQSVVEFRMVDGRIYHRGLELEFPDVAVRTYGSVGLDQSLAIMAEMPVPAAWKAGGLLGSALRDQTIRLPIAGTLSKPKLDRKVFDEVRGQFFQKAAKNMLEDEVGQGLDRLFRSLR